MIPQNSPASSLYRFNSLAEIPAVIAAAHRFPTQCNFFLSLDWYECIFDTVLSQSGKARIYAWQTQADTSNTHAALFLTAPSSKRALHSMTNYYSMEFGPSIPHNQADISNCVQALVTGIASAPSPHALELHLLRDDLSATSELQSALVSNGFLIEREDTYKNWFFDVKGLTFAEYFAARPSQLRNTVTRKEKKLIKEHVFEIKVLRRADEAHYQQAIADYIAIYNSSWKRPEPFPRFIPELVNTCARLGILRLGIAYVDGVPAAAQLWITTKEKALIYKLAYDERFVQLSAGSVLTKEMFRIAIDEDRAAEIDYGIGDEAYKRDWMSGCRQFCTLRAYNRRSLGGKILIFRELLKRIAKKALRRA